MRTDDFIDVLNQYGLRVFTIEDATKLLKKPRNYVSLYLSKSKRIVRIERGKYFIEGTGAYEIASHILSPSYLSLVSALKLYGLTTQIPIQIYVISTKRHMPVKLKGYAINFIKIDKGRFFGYVNNNGISLATVEKAILDSLYFNISFGDTADAFGTALLRGKIDIVRLKELALYMKSPALISKLGFMLSLYGINAEDLLKKRSKNYIILSKAGKSRDKKWRVVYESDWKKIKQVMVNVNA